MGIMEFILTVNRGLNKQQVFIDPSPEIIEEAIDGIIPADFYFAILEKSERPVDDFWYIQAAMFPCGYDAEDEYYEAGYYAEINYLNAGGFEHYRLESSDAGEVKRLFSMFSQGVAPDISNWVNITDEIKSLPDADTQMRELKERNRLRDGLGSAGTLR